jgi:hypothetical protein
MEKLLSYFGSIIRPMNERYLINIFTYVYEIFRNSLLTTGFTSVCYLSKRQFLMKCFLDFTGTFLCNIVQVVKLLYLSFALEFIVSIDKPLQY